MKLFRLIAHHKNFSEEDLIINPKDYPGAKEGNIVEIYHPDDEGPRLLLQIKSFKEDLQSRETITVEHSIASAFGLRTYADVYVRLVSPLDVSLDSVELTFKDQYMGRSEMWRLKNSLVNTCVYMNKKIEFCGNSVRCQVYEMWSQGDRVACGVITDDTKVVFRSSTSMVYLFLQMSSEMWDFDIHGDLYFEKAVNGFLADLFQKWKKNGSNHEVTIVLFSRTFYEASSLEEFPLYMRECLQQDYRGRYYEDFYRVAIQNERYDDWSVILVQLRRLFSHYLKIVLEYHSRPGENIPVATNSTAAQGNFLEVLNMSLNVFEKHYLDRSFDRTGQLSVVITPGVGVFEVDRELTNVTKQRIIDNGVGSDLVCVGEQPLHAVPLLKFHNKDSQHIKAPDDYSMPHWINLSFYSTNKKVAYSNFIPRIKLPPIRTTTNGQHQQKPKTTSVAPKAKLIPEDEYIHNSFFDYDAYDAQVFQLPSVHGTRSLQRNATRMKKNSITAEEMREAYNRHTRRKLSDPDIHHNELINSVTPRSQAITIPPALVNIATTVVTSSPVASPHSGNSEGVTDGGDMSSPYRAVVGSAGSPPPCLGTVPMIRPGRALINPFDPSHVTIKLTSNRRRWTHIFPKGPSGVLIQQHHYQAVPTAQSNVSSNIIESTSNGFPSSSSHIDINHHQHHHQQYHHHHQHQQYQQQQQQQQLTRSVSQVALHEYGKKRLSLLPTNCTAMSSSMNPPKSQTLLWGATGEQEWTPALTTVNQVIIGVDWKSLTIPACLPITTDYFPDQRSLQNDYVVSDYNLLPDDVNADFAQQRAIYKKPLTTVEVFRELISQRLSQGFQLIVLPVNNNETPQTPGAKQQQQNISSGSVVVGNRGGNVESTQEYLLSIGRVFHKISLCGSTITVTRYRPRHPYPPFNFHYRYRFHAPHHDTYEISLVSFTTEKLENYNWNYLDHYICTRGDTDFSLAEALKYWRFRVYLLPLNNSATKRIIEGSKHCDIYQQPTATDHAAVVDGFLKFIETVVNKIKRPNVKKPRMSLCVSSLALPQTLLAPRRYSMSNVSISQNAVVGNSPFRERLGSNRLPERPRPRSGSKVMERGRVSPATEAVQPLKIEQDMHENEENNGNPNINNNSSSSSNNNSNSSNNNNNNNNTNNNNEQNQLLKENSSFGEILEAMRHPVTGVGFLTTHQSLPSFTFVSADGVHWLIQRLEGITSIEQAVNFMNTMLRERLICHASGDFTKHFVFGFYLYHIVMTPNNSSTGIGTGGDKETNATSTPEYLQPLGDLQSFENEWIEVEVRPCRIPDDETSPSTTTSTVITTTTPTSNTTTTTTTTSTSNSTSSNITSTKKFLLSNNNVTDRERGVPLFLRDTINIGYLHEELDNDYPLYKHIHLEIDLSNKSDRIEWGHARYQTVFRPDQAYELVVQWVTASGPIVSDLLFGWARKAQACGLQLIPIPHDPLALPYSTKSDPLRGPIFIPLNVNCLLHRGQTMTPTTAAAAAATTTTTGLFDEFRADTWDDRLFLFQEAIVTRFGFISCVPDSNVTSPTSATAKNNNQVVQEHQYIHCTGAMFILIPIPTPRFRNRLTSIVSQRRIGGGGGGAGGGPSNSGINTSGIGGATATTTTGAAAGGGGIGVTGGIGSMTAKIPTASAALAANRRYPIHNDVVPSPHEAYITRHVSGKNKDDYDNYKRTGFLWSWNHMISRRWRTTQNLDVFQMRLLRDFKEFCENKDQRLRNYWDHCWELKEIASTMPG